MASRPPKRRLVFPSPFDERRRRAPRIRNVVVAAGAITISFKDRMDTTRSMAVFRVFDSVLGVVEFTNFSWTDEFTLISNTSSVVSASYSGDSYGDYMSGNIRYKRRFELFNYSRCYIISITGGGDTGDIDGGDAVGSFTEAAIDGGDAVGSFTEAAIDGGTA